MQVSYKKIEGNAEQVEPDGDAEMKNEDGEENKEERVGDHIVKRKKIQFFKFWPKALLQSAWQSYMVAAETDLNLNAAYMSVQVFDRVTDQFVLNQVKKQNKKAEKIGQQREFLEQYAAGNKTIKPPASATSRTQQKNMKNQFNTWQRSRANIDYSKYFEGSSESEEDEQEPIEEQKNARVSERQKRLQKRNNRFQDDDSDEASQNESEDEDESEEEVAAPPRGQRGRPRGSRGRPPNSSRMQTTVDPHAQRSSKMPSRSERAKLRNLRRGAWSEEELEVSEQAGSNSDMRDDAIAEQMEEDISGEDESESVMSDEVPKMRSRRNRVL